MEHGGNIYKFKNMKCSIIDFSANINPFGISESVSNAIMSAIDEIQHYPDPLYSKLTEAISEFHGVNTGNIVCGNGGADIIYRLVHCLKPKRAVVPVPVFTEYEDALIESECRISYYKINHEDFIIKSDILDMIDNCTDLIVVCNPDNPTGILTQKELLVKIAKKSHQCGAVFFVDECFNDMISSPEEYSMINEISKYENVFILKSMTKMYSAAGLRLGYGISGSTALIEMVKKSGQPWPVNIFAEKAGIAMLNDKKYRDDFRKYMFKEKNYLKCGLEKLGFKVFDSQANYIFFYSDKYKELDRTLIKYGLLIRNCSDYTGLNSGYYRIAVLGESDNRYLLETLEKIIL